MRSALKIQRDRLNHNVRTSIETIILEKTTAAYVLSKVISKGNSNEKKLLSLIGLSHNYSYILKVFSFDLKESQITYNYALKISLR